MKLSEYHKSHGLSGTIRAFDTNTEIHFSFEKGKTRTGVELNMGGHAVEGYLEIFPVPTKDPNAEFDVALYLVAGPRPPEDYQPNPKAVGGSTKPVAVPAPTFELPAAPPGLVPIPERQAEPARYEPVEGKFDPGPPPPPPEPAVVEEAEPDTAKVATVVTPAEIKEETKEPPTESPRGEVKEPVREERKAQAPKGPKTAGRR